VRILTPEIKKPGIRVEAVLTVSFSDKFFLQFFKVLVMSFSSLSVCLKIGATQFHKVEVNVQRWRR